MALRILAGEIVARAALVYVSPSGVAVGGAARVMHHATMVTPLSDSRRVVIYCWITDARRRREPRDRAKASGSAGSKATCRAGALGRG